MLGVVDRVPLIPSARSGNLDQDCRSQRGHEFDNRLVNISYRLGETRTRSLGPCVILCHRKLLARELLDCGDRGNLGIVIMHFWKIGTGLFRLMLSYKMNGLILLPQFHFGAVHLSMMCSS